MRTFFAAIALIASLSIGIQANAQQTRMVLQEPAIQPYLQPAPSYNCASLGFYGQFIPGYGIKVLSVVPHSKADELGFENGDVLKRINGVKITSEFQYRLLLNNAVKYEHGHVDILVRNVRWDWGHHVPKYVTVHTHIECHSPYGGGGGHYGHND